MKKEIKKRRVNTKNKNTTHHDTKNIKSRVNKKNIKLQNSIMLAVLIVYIVVVALAYLKTKVIIAIGLAIILGFIIGSVFLLIKLKGKSKKKFITLLLMLVLAGTITVMGIFAAFLLYVKSLADPLYKENIKNLVKPEPSTIYLSDGTELTKLGSEMREKVTYEELPEVLIDAIVATEDSRFFQHNGFDAPRFIKASLGQVIGNKGAGGASTLSMQVVKNVFTNANADEGIEGITRKFEDIYLAVFKLEKNYTKEQIIEFYVNNHFLGGNVYGVQEASEFYFGKPVTELNLSEAAIIAGMFKSPNAYRPDTHPEQAEARRKVVLYLMQRHGYITEEERAMANSIPASSLVSQQEVKPARFQDFIDTIVAEVKDKYKVNPYTSSVDIHTTLDIAKQNAVDRVLSGEAYSWINDKVQTGVAVLDSETGAILAIGAGRNRSGLSTYNNATQIRRQPGSTAKPLFDYGPGMEYNNWSTYTPFDDAPYSYSNGRSIKNWDGGYYGNITLRRALSTSRNIPALKAFQQVENKNIREFVSKLGLEAEYCNAGYEYDAEKDICINEDTEETQRPSLHEAHSIGAFTGVSPLQMAAAYAAFSNGGYYNEPYSVAKITFKTTGETVEHEPNKVQVMSDATAFMISSVLQDVALTGGTPRNVACKTGTTNYDDRTMDNYNMPGDAIRDSWVIGYSTKTVIGMWYGYDKLTHDMVNQGYVLHNVPATIQKDRLFNALVNSGAMESNRSAFVQPSSVVKIGIAQGTNPPKLAGPGTSAIYEYFKKGTEPTETAYGEATIYGPTGLKATVDKTTKEIKLSWNSVSPGEWANDSYGKFGYNIYLNNRLLTWTDKTSYTAKEFGTYKIVATYKGYSGVKSNGAEITVTEPVEEEPENPSGGSTGTETNPTPTPTPSTPTTP